MARNNSKNSDITSSKSTKSWTSKLKNIFTRDTHKDANTTSSPTEDSPRKLPSSGPTMDGGKNVDKVQEERDRNKQEKEGNKELSDSGLQN
jgi:hypothetical protein